VHDRFSRTLDRLGRVRADAIAVLSGDTVIVRPKEAPEKGKAQKER
jgi:translation initiation factor IF-1